MTCCQNKIVPHWAFLHSQILRRLRQDDHLSLWIWDHIAMLHFQKKEAAASFIFLVVLFLTKMSFLIFSLVWKFFKKKFKKINALYHYCSCLSGEHLSFFFVCVCVSFLGFELGSLCYVGTLQLKSFHQPFFVLTIFEIGSLELFAQADFEL
jgi:hypothetical protein